MYCKNCGAELVPGAAFCASCGTKVEVNESSQPTHVEPMTQQTDRVLNDEVLFNFESTNKGYLIGGIIICSVVLVACIAILAMGSIPIPGVVLILGIQFIVIGTKKRTFTVTNSGVEANWSGKHFYFSVEEIDYDKLQTNGARLTLNKINFNGFAEAQSAYNAIMGIKPL